MDSEVVNVIIAVAVIYFVVRWFTSGNSNNSGNASASANIAKTLGFKPKNATPEMIASVRSAFPDIPTENIHYDLLRTGSVELTVNRLLERGYLDAPPAAYRRAFPPATTSQASTTSTATTTGTKATPTNPQSLIERFNLQTKVDTEPATPSNEGTNWDGTGPIPSAAKGKGKAVETNDATGAGKWEATAEQRQQSLQKRKEAMILAARRRLLEKDAASSGSTQ